jgi:hypothetical protein
MRKILDHIIWLFVGFSLAAVAVNHWMLVRHNNEMLLRNNEVLKQLQTFKQVGPRFTADNGQDLCESVRELQRHVGIPVRTCDFAKAN